MLSKPQLWLAGLESSQAVDCHDTTGLRVSVIGGASSRHRQAEGAGREELTRFKLSRSSSFTRTMYSKDLGLTSLADNTAPVGLFSPSYT